MSQHNDGIHLGLAAVEEELRAEPAAEIPARPLAARIIASRPSDAELVADYRARIYGHLHAVATIKDEMKKDSFDFNFSWGVDAFGRAVPGPIIVFKIFP
jgi:hypothetical protein